MSVKRCDVTEIDSTHHMVRAFYHADYEKDGRPIRIDFDVTYLLDSSAGQPKILAFIAGDEMGLFKKYGLVN